ncbi:uncharacterized protein LOC121428426 isoform X1 [Lytechinus variegatus]|uniref:uncharacterized protein LOC121428426 isoform X1 n=1 Tax=Lytechinus variegatus TaxID=7654 RepID=UPI001BB25B76|nr:uncharacterized protein LOC121428426 isoform X1 [Lytechinus variegatus]
MKSSYCVSMMFLLSSYFARSDCYILSSFHLVNSGSPNEGRVEVTVIDEDGDEELRGVVVSNDRWTIDEANWVCEELGYRHAVFLPDDSRFERGLQSNIFSIDNRTLVVPDCDSDGLGNCSEIEAAGVVCQKPGYLGCFLIRSSALPNINISETSQVLTNEQCLDICMDLSAPFAAQRGDTCYCLNNFSISSKERVCNTRCIGNPEQFCGRQQRDSYIVFNVSVGFCPEISGANLNVYGRYRFGDIVRANCSGGKQLMGDDALQCVGGPDIFQWNGTIPTCVDMITIQPRMTSDPSTDQTRRTLTPHLHTDTTSLNTVTFTMVIDSGSSSMIVLVVAPAVTVVSIVVLLAACLTIYFINKRRKQSAIKKDDTISYKAKSDVLVHNTKSAPINEDPSYYEVVENAAPKSSDLNDGVTVLYESADDVRTEPHQYELESPIDTPHHGLIDNVLYKPSWREGDSSMNNYEVFEMESHSKDGTSHDQHASPKSQQMKIDLTSNKHENYFSTDNKLCDEPERSNRTDNGLYNRTDKLNLQTDSISPNYYEIKSDPIGRHYSEVSSPLADTCPTYHDIQPQPASSSLIETPGDPSHDVSKEDTISSIPEYATVNKTARSEKPSDKSSEANEQNCTWSRNDSEIVG